MNLWNTFEIAKQDPKFSTERLQIRVRNRINTSLDKISYSNAEVNLSEATARVYTDESRYLSASNVTFELLISVYDVNSRSMLVMRPSRPFAADELGHVHEFVSRQKHPNIEVRLIGLQSSSGNTLPMLDSIEQILKTVGGNLMEVDLFGNNIRHIAFDTRTGLSYDLFMQNKIYGPHELANEAKESEFAAKVSKLKFV